MLKNKTAFYQLQAVTKKPLIDVSGFFMSFNLQQNNIFQIGLFYRTWYEMGLLLGIDVTSAFHLSYSYDFNVSNIRRHSIGTHELMLTYKFKEKPPCINCWY